jgi:hypothetical protein
MRKFLVIPILLIFAQCKNKDLLKESTTYTSIVKDTTYQLNKIGVVFTSTCNPEILFVNDGFKVEDRKIDGKQTKAIILKDLTIPVVEKQKETTRIIERKCILAHVKWYHKIALWYTLISLIVVIVYFLRRLKII